MEITLDTNRQLFVLNAGNSVSCMGFRVVYEQGCEIIRRLAKKIKGISPLKEDDIGTIAQYEQYRGLISQYQLLGDSATWFDGTTPPEVQRVLETARRTGATLRLFTGDSETGRDWMGEYDAIGRVSRSMGPMRVPILVGTGEYGGGAILTNCLVRILDVTSGRELYRHKTYHLPEMRIIDGDECFKSEGYTHSVVTMKNGEEEVIARFASQGKAANWIAFMCGETFKLD